MLVVGDVYKHAAIDQLAILGKQVLEVWNFTSLKLIIVFFEKYASSKYNNQCHFKF